MQNQQIIRPDKGTEETQQLFMPWNPGAFYFILNSFSSSWKNRFLKKPQWKSSAAVVSSHRKWMVFHMDSLGQPQVRRVF